MTKASTAPISPIRVSPNGRHFVDRDGNPVFWLGDTQWELFRLFSEDDALCVLADRQAKGFNVILIMLTGVAGDGEPPLANIDGETPWIDDDPLRPNEAYFRHVDTILRLGEQTDQTFVVGVYHKWHVDMITIEKARAWARWVAQRYRDAPNLIWSMYPEAREAYIPVCRELAAGLQEGDGGRHLISVHPDPSVASSSFLHGEAWLAFNTIQTHVTYDRIHDMVAADYARTPVKPVVMAEGGYEDARSGQLTPHSVRQQAYWTQLGGAYHAYGHENNYRSPTTWRQWIDSPGSRQLRIFREVITSCDAWWDLVPDQSLFLSGAGAGYSLNMAARSAAGKWVLAYLSGPSTVSVRLDALTAGSKVRAFWTDPTSGARCPAGTFAASGAGTFTSPQEWQDAVLLLESV
jgi:hypothetical protein